MNPFGRTALIDADSLIYLVAWNFRDLDQEEFHNSDEEVAPRVKETTDMMIKEILQQVQADQYLGAMGHPFLRCFRTTVARYSPYKAGRGADHPVVAKWKPVIKEHMKDDWGFIYIPELEADDVISLVAEELGGDNYIVCSPDKDLLQIPGAHYDYKKTDFQDVTREQSEWLFWYQMMVGDSTDGIAGLPGVGDKKARDKMKDIPNERLEALVKREYLRYFGDHYGSIIFDENRAVVGLMKKDHLYYDPEYAMLKEHIHPYVTGKLKEFGIG